MVELEAWRIVATRVRRLLVDGWCRLPRPMRWLLLALAAAAVVWTATTAAAYADGGSQGPAGMGWMKLTDARGVPIGNFQLSLDYGGKLDIVAKAWAIFTTLVWGIYVLVVMIAIWLIDYALSFDWLAVLSGPFTTIGTALHQVVTQVGVVPTLLTITALMTALWMFRGRWATGMFEVLMSCLIAALATGVLGNPVHLVAGKPDGMLYQARDVGFAVAGGMAGKGPQAGPDDVRHVATEEIASTFIRVPHQLVNYGRVLDGGKCETVYTEAVKKATTADDVDDVRDKVGDCDKAAGDWADNPGSGSLMTALMFLLPAFLLLGVGILIAGAVMVAGCYALYSAAKLVVALLAGMLPGTARGPLWATIADLIISLVMVAFTVVFLTAYMMVLRAVFTQEKVPSAKLFLLADVFIVVGAIVFWKARGRIKTATDRLSQAMSRRPGAAAAAPRQRRPFSAAEVYYKGRMARQAVVGARSMLGRSRSTAGAPAGQGVAGGTSSTVLSWGPGAAGSKVAAVAGVAAAAASGGATAVAGTAAKKAAGSKAAAAVARAGTASARRRRVEAAVRSRTIGTAGQGAGSSSIAAHGGAGPVGGADLGEVAAGRRRIPAAAPRPGGSPAAGAGAGAGVNPTSGTAAQPVSNPARPVSRPGAAAGELPPTHSEPRTAAAQLRSQLRQRRSPQARPARGAGPGVGRGRAAS